MGSKNATAVAVAMQTESAMQMLANGGIRESALGRVDANRNLCSVSCAVSMSLAGILPFQLEKKADR